MECPVGIDVSKATLDTASLPDAETWVVTNDDAGLPVVVANLRQVRDFAKSIERLAKTDAIDAGVLALFGERAERPRGVPARTRGSDDVS